MAAHIFSESGQVQEVDIPDIFDVLEGGEDENAVKYLLGFSGEGEGGAGAAAAGAPTAVVAGGADGAQALVSPSPSTTSSSATAGDEGASVSSAGLSIPVSIANAPHGYRIVKNPDGTERVVRRRDTSGAKAIYACGCCTKAFTTKFNLKRHINMHCLKSKEAGVPVQGPPSANSPTKKPMTHRIPKCDRDALKTPQSADDPASPSPVVVQASSSPATVMVGASPTSPPPVIASTSTAPILRSSVAPGTLPGTAGIPVRMQPVVVAAQPALPKAVVQVAAPAPQQQPVVLAKGPDVKPGLQTLQIVTTPQQQVQRPITIMTSSTSSGQPTRVVMVSGGGAGASTNTVPLLQTVPSVVPSSSATPVPSTAVFPLASSSGTAASMVANLTPIVVDASAQQQHPVKMHVEDDDEDEDDEDDDDEEGGGPFLGGPNGGGAGAPSPPLAGSLSITMKARRPLTRPPDGWARKPVFDRAAGGVRVSYYDASGRRFRSQAEVDRHLARAMGCAAAPGVFDFAVSDEDRRAVGGSPPPTFYQPPATLRERSNKHLQRQQCKLTSNPSYA